MNNAHIQGLPIEFDCHQTYDERSKDWKWFWGMWSEKNEIAQSTDPQDDEQSCINQILQVIRYIRVNDNIPITNRNTGLVVSYIIRPQ